MAHNGIDSSNIFRRTLIDNSGHRILAYEVICGGCAASETVKMTTQSRGISEETLRKQFSNKGWVIPANVKKSRCPECAGTRKVKACGTEAPTVEEEMSAPKVVYEREKPIPAPTGTAEAITKAIETVVGLQPAKDPPKPGPLTNRKIMDALDGCYAPEQQRYKGGYTDDTVAKALGVPRKWVSDIREQFFGPERTEADAVSLKDLEAAKRDMATLEKLIEDCMTLYSAIKGRIEAAEKRLRIPPSAR